MKVTPVSKTLDNLLRGNFLRIPRFQRPYDWDRDNLTEFWSDLKDRSEPDYFMGSLVVFGDLKEKNQLSLVDGQQRITTITIMLSIIRNVLTELGEDGPANAIHELIEGRDLDNKRRFVLEHDPADGYFQRVVQLRNPERVTPDGVQQENLQSAFKYLDHALRSHLSEKFLTNDVKKVQYLKHLRDCVLQMHFIVIELDNEDDAYLIFETLNTRGKDLRASDLLKNHFMRLIPQKTKGLDQAKGTWNQIIEKLNSGGVDTDSFLLHYWLSHHSSVSKAKLFLEYKSKIKKSNAKNWLASLGVAAGTYVKFMAPLEASWQKEERPLKESLYAIRIFGVTQAAPLLLSLLTLYENKVISLKSVKSSVELIEKFTFQFNALTQSRGGGGVSNMYAKLAQSAVACEDSQDFVRVHAEMKTKFRERLPDEAEFILRFSRIMFKSTYTRDRNLVRYVLTKIARHLGMPDEIDTTQLTIEHILPQSHASEDTDDEMDVGAIGNLILVSEALNGKADAKPFNDKKKLFTVANNVYVDPYLDKATTWTFDDIAERGEELAKLGYHSIWKI